MQGLLTFRFPENGDHAGALLDILNSVVNSSSKQYFTASSSELLTSLLPPFFETSFLPFIQPGQDTAWKRKKLGWYQDSSGTERNIARKK